MRLLLTQEADASWSAHILDLDVVTHGRDVWHAIAMAQEAVALVREWDAEEGHDPPRPCVAHPSRGMVCVREHAGQGPVRVVRPPLLARVCDVPGVQERSGRRGQMTYVRIQDGRVCTIEGRYLRPIGRPCPYTPQGGALQAPAYATVRGRVQCADAHPVGSVGGPLIEQERHAGGGRWVWCADRLPSHAAYIFANGRVLGPATVETALLPDVRQAFLAVQEDSANEAQAELVRLADLESIDSLAPLVRAKAWHLVVGRGGRAPEPIPADVVTHWLEQ